VGIRHARRADATQARANSCKAINATRAPKGALDIRSTRDDLMRTQGRDRSRSSQDGDPIFDRRPTHPARDDLLYPGRTISRGADALTLDFGRPKAISSSLVAPRPSEAAHQGGLVARTADLALAQASGSI